MNLYSLYDCKADGYTPPFVAKNDEMAKRTVLDALANLGKCQLTQYPEDFTLFRIGDWDEDSGEIYGLDSKFAVGNVLQLARAMQKDEAPIKTGSEVE